MKRRLVWLCFGLLSAVLVSAVPSSVHSASFEALQPGQLVTYTQEIPINIVLIGYDQRNNGRKDAVVNKQALLAELPETYAPVVRYPLTYGLSGRDMGLEYSFSYKFIETDDSWENRFFGWLGTQGRVAAPTLYQQCYSGTAPNENSCTNQTKNRRQITRTRYIDAPSVERYLADNTRQLLGANAQRSYTIYLINWYSRSDFQDHVYTKTSEPDPDTGFNFGVERASRKMIAWGGSYSRSWFYDLSAGPEYWTRNYNVDDKDIDGDGVADYTIPPIWEYADGGYRQLSAISRDLGLVTRYVAINLLFTTSAFYDPMNTAPGLGGDKVVHVETLQDDPGSVGVDVFNRQFTQQRLAALQPYHRWQLVQQYNYPLDSGAKRALQLFTGLAAPNSRDCANYYPYNIFGGALYCYFNERLAQYVPRYDDADYVAEVFNYKTDDFTKLFTPLGYADDNYQNGTQSYVFGFWSPATSDAGYGLTITTVHEVGHHLGLSHPHDGYDSETGVDYGPEGETLFAWSGDESNTVMTYIDLNYDFGHFDQDNMRRWETAGYLNLSNELLAEIEFNPNAGSVDALLEQADTTAGSALTYFEQWKYHDSATQARKTYETVLQAAAQLGIPARQAAPLRIAPSDAGEHLKQEPWPINAP